MKISASVILLLAAATVGQAQRFRPYEILGVKRTASPEEIKKANLEKFVIRWWATRTFTPVVKSGASTRPVS